jgi:hypothetical protein
MISISSFYHLQQGPERKKASDGGFYLLLKIRLNEDVDLAREPFREYRLGTVESWLLILQKAEWMQVDRPYKPTSIYRRNLRLSFYFFRSVSDILACRLVVSSTSNDNGNGQRFDT